MADSDKAPEQQPQQLEQQSPPQQAQQQTTEAVAPAPPKETIGELIGNTWIFLGSYSSILGDAGCPPYVCVSGASCVSHFESRSHCFSIEKKNPEFISRQINAFWVIFR